MREFQGNNKLAADVEAGPMTMGVIEELLRKLGLPPGGQPAAAMAVRSIAKEALGMDGQNKPLRQAMATTSRQNGAAPPQL